MKRLENRNIFAALRTGAHFAPLSLLVFLSYFDYALEASFIVKLLNTSALFLAIFFFGQHTRVVFSPEAKPSALAAILFLPFIITTHFFAPDLLVIFAISFLMATLAFWEHIARGCKSFGLSIFLHSKFYLLIAVMLNLLGVFATLPIAVIFVSSVFLTWIVFRLFSKGVVWRMSSLPVGSNSSIWVTSIANLVNSNLDVLVASYFLQPAESVQYFLLSRIIRAPEPYVISLVAHLNTELSSCSNGEAMLRVFRGHQTRVLRLLLIYVLLVTIVSLVARHYFPIDLVLVAIICISFCLLQVVSGHGFLLVRMGKYFPNLIVSCLGAAAGLGFVLVLVLKGFEGSAYLLASTIFLSALVKFLSVRFLLSRPI
ncbi:hypothetical protein [Shimia sediminis]|uniref:hypothetical protein n=1 Tax=Shimia sediminis TaxID=2497945 RepID=UPI000F8CCB2C|nr:hypothetical protein [Shimia sediminis]